MNPNVIVFGAISGLLYALSSVSLVLVYRASRHVNFALGGMGGLAAYVAYTVLSHNMPYYVAWIASAVTGALLGWLTEILVVRRLGGRRHIVAGIGTLGVLLVLQGIAEWQWGTQVLPVPDAFGNGQLFQWHSLVITDNDAYIVGVCVVLLALLHFVTQRTTFGLTIRAAAQGPITSAGLGVNVTRVSSWSWTVGGLVGATAALMVVPTTTLSPQSFTNFLFFGFAAVVIGGLTSVYGVIIGGVLFGVVINIIEYYVTTLLTNTIALFFVTLVLLLRPQGLFGKRERSVPEVSALRASGFVENRQLDRLKQNLSSLQRKAQAVTVTRFLPDRLTSVLDQERRTSPSRRWGFRGATVAVWIAIAIALPYVSGNGVYALLPTIAASVPAFVGLIVLYGWAGQVSVGNGAFLGIGAYSAALLIKFVHIPFPGATVLAVLISFAAGLVVGLPALRIRSYVHFAVYTFMVANAIPELIDFFTNWTGGESGISLAATINPGSNPMGFYWMCATIALVVCGAVAATGWSRLGRRWRAVRDSAAGAEAAGVAVRPTILAAFGVSAALTGLSGVLEGAAGQVIGPESYAVWASIYLLAGVVVGGAESIAGAAIGAAFVSLLPYYTGILTTSTSPDLSYGIVLIIVLIVAPKGIVGLAKRLVSSHAAVRPETKAALAEPSTAASLGTQTAPVISSGVTPLPAAGTVRRENGSVSTPEKSAITDPLLEVRALSVAYDDLVAVRDINLTVRRNEVVCLLGPNGAGKSTVLRSIMGVARTVAGQVILDGDRLTGHRPWQVAERGIAYVVEGRAVFPDLSVHDNLRLGASATAAARQQAAQTEREVLELFPELTGRLSQTAGSLSGGQQQMLAIGRGLMARPRLLLLDEPSLGLSPRLAKELFGRLKTMKSSGLAMLIVEQNSVLALDIADRVYVMRAGELQASWDAAEASRNLTDINAYLGVEDLGHAAESGQHSIAKTLESINSRPLPTEQIPSAGASEPLPAPGSGTLDDLTIDNLTVTYGATEVVHSVALRVPRLGRVGLIGPNGAGKSSIINAVCGVVAPRRGRVVYRGIDDTSLSPHKRARLGMRRTYQNLELFSGMSVIDNLRVPAEATYAAAARSPGGSGRETHLEVEELMDLLGLTKVADRLVGELPYGIRKLVEFGRCLAGNPSLILLDEPAAGLDSAEKRDLVEQIDRLLLHVQAGVLLIEHDMTTVRALCGADVYVLDAGSVIAHGSFDEVSSDRVVAEAYLGSTRDTV
jgi:ABC-type branched-subunit amino acid transport system ATPase component/branched-subunit amino acid ABC-type transport system permease component